MRRVSFHRFARRELSDAAYYYDIANPGLGKSFIAAVERTCRSIAENPTAGTAIVGTLRRRLVKRFPYALLYSVESGNIRILAVANLRRRPMYWIDRDPA